MGTNNTADTGKKGSGKITKKPASTTASGSVKKSAPTGTGAGAGADGHKPAKPVKTASRPSSSAGADAPPAPSGQPGKGNPTPHEDEDPAPPLHKWKFPVAVFKPRNGPPKRIQSLPKR